jgi:NADH-quinone oxidoreductase subunit L
MDDTIRNCLILIPALPLAAAVLVAALGPRLLRGYSHWPVILALVGSFVMSLVLLREVGQRQVSVSVGNRVAIGGYEEVVTLWNWVNVENAYDLAANPPAVREEEAGWRNFRVDVTLRADALTAMMLSMVTFVSSLVALYASGYMQGDRGYWRFFAYIGLFVFSMTMLVSVSNFVLLFVFWEAVGVCSYLLIGFWYQKPEAAAAGMKAFLVNRVGDFAFTIAMFSIWCTYGTLNFHDVEDSGFRVQGSGPSAADSLATSHQPPALIRGVLGKSRIASNDYVTGGLATAICLLLLLGACGKSAQFPLHVWLPDAMEGPTPVSALIHAATMVTAGVYMVARCSPLFAVSPTAQLVVASIGGFTALLAGLIALTQFDLKRVLAYSTVSQLGFMFLALGAGTFAGVTSGMYHLFTHAFFKALLFLGAGSVMHVMGGVIDMRQFGGLRRLMPYTHWTFLVGCLALSGVFPLAGFWSKDAVLGSVHDKIHAIEHEQEHRAGHGAADAGTHHELREGDGTRSVPTTYESWSERQLATSRFVYQWLYYSAVFTAFLTAFYTFRAFAMTFYGPLRVPPQAGHHAHESPPVMVVPLVLLAGCSALVGIVMIANPLNLAENRLVDFLACTPSLAGQVIAAPVVAPVFHMDVAGLSTLVALAGIGLALFLYLGEPNEAISLRRMLNLEGIDRATNPQWVGRLEQIRWIAAITRSLRRVGLGFLVTLLALLLALVSLVLSVPLVVATFLTPYRLSRDKFYFDEIYAALIVWPLRIVAAICSWFDRWIIDGLVDLMGRVPAAAGYVMRSMQMGLVQFYALAMVLGMLILVAARLMWAAG